MKPDPADPWAPGEGRFAFSPADRKRLAVLGDKCIAALERVARVYQFFRPADSKATRSKVHRDMKRERVLLYAVARSLAPLAEAGGDAADAGAWYALHALGVDGVREMHARATRRTAVLTRKIADSCPVGPPRLYALTALRRDVRDVLAQHGVRGVLRDVAAARAVSAIVGRKVSDPLRLFERGTNSPNRRRASSIRSQSPLGARRAGEDLNGSMAFVQGVQGQVHPLGKHDQAADRGRPLAAG